MTQATRRAQELGHSLAQTLGQATTKAQERRRSLAQTVERANTKVHQRRESLAQTVERANTKVHERRHDLAERVGQAGGRTLPRMATFLVTARAHLLAFSLPYLWVWTEGLDGIVRVALIAAHGATLLAVATASTAADWSRGVMPRLGLLPGTRWSRPQAASTWAEVLALIAVAAIAAVAVSRVSWPVPVTVALLLVAGWMWARAPLSFKYLGAPEIAGPIIVLVAPAAALALATPASPPMHMVVAGTALMAATFLATMLADRGADLAADIPTVATRRPLETRGWLWLTGIVGALLVLTRLYLPLGFADMLGLVGALGFVGGCALRRLRVPVLIAAHALIGLYWLFG